MIILSKVEHRGNPRIKIAFHKDFKIIRQIKTLHDARFSWSMKAWHIAFTAEAYHAFLGLDLPFKIQTSGTAGHIGPKSETNGIEELTSNSVPSPPSDCPSIVNEVQGDADIVHSISVEFHDRVFYIQTKYKESIIQKIRDLQSSWWNAGLKKWIAKASIGNLEKIQKEFHVWDTGEYNKLYEMVALLDDPMIVELYRTPDNVKNIWVKLSGYKVDVEYMKHIPDRHYDKTYRRWSIPNDPNIVERIISHFKEKKAKVINRLPELNEKAYRKTNDSPGQKQKKLIDKFEKRHQGLVKEVSAVMIAQRYSWSTIKSYIGNLVHYADYLNGKSMHKASAKEANDFVRYISNMDVSESKINAVINSIKFFYVRVIFRPDFEIDKIKRPRKSKKLPYILSKGEMEQLLQSLDNVKHITILYTLYSSGMRLSELLSLKVDDVFFDRNQLFIRGGKGKKDRVVMLSEVLKRLLILYSEKYKPIYWLFEGQDRKKQYSAGSVQRVVKNASRKAGISKKVTPHMIRHCFATHLLDNGTDIRFIQELLGHKDIKTTLIYTHVTNQSINSIKSPLDSLDILDKNVEKPEE